MSAGLDFKQHPLTIAKPTSAFFSAGPSLVPSPVTATTCLWSTMVLSIMPVECVNTGGQTEAGDASPKSVKNDRKLMNSSHCEIDKDRRRSDSNDADVHFTFDERVFVGGGGSGQHPQLGPNLVDTLLLHLGANKAGKKGQVFVKQISTLFPPPQVKAPLPYSAPVLWFRTSPFSLRILRLNSLPSMQRKSSPGWMMPHLMAMARAVLMLSPVTMRTVMPARWHFWMASGT